MSENNSRADRLRVEALAECSAPALTEPVIDSGQVPFFFSPDWFHCLASTALRQGWRPRIYRVSDDRGAVCMLFCASRPEGRLHSLTNYYTIEYGPLLLRPDAGRAALQKLAEHIAGERPRWRALCFTHLRDDHAGTELLLQALANAGFFLNRFRQFDNWYLPLPDSADFAGYYQGRPSRLKNTIKRREKKTRQTHQLTLQIYRHPGSELEQAIDDYQTIYNSSWKRREPYPEFMPSLIRLCARLGALRLGFVYLDGQPAAAQVWITRGGRSIIYKLAYQEQFKPLSVGSILSRELMRVAIDEDRVREIDYGVGSEPYKRDWMTDCRQIGGVEAFPRRSWFGQIQINLTRIKRLVKRWRPWPTDA